MGKEKEEGGVNLQRPPLLFFLEANLPKPHAKT